MNSDNIQKWEPDDFYLQDNSVWSFPERGDWATHKGDYRGNWSPYVPRNLILRYSKEGDMVLDPFVGSGTTLVEAKLLCRNAVGVDINEEALRIAQERIAFSHEGANGKVYLRQGDARKLDFVPNNSIDLVCLHPPYADIIKYSRSIQADLSHLSPPKFVEAMRDVANEMHRVLKRGKVCAVLIADARKKGYIEPISFQTMQVFCDVGFKLKEIIIKQQHNCRMTDKWKEASEMRNFLLIAHEYLFILKK